jgi:DNA repair protein RadA/Sms
MREVVSREPKGRRIASPSGRPERLEAVKGETRRRLETGIGELDRVLGGGLVPGQAALVGGEPGIGKSTLLLQVAGARAAAGGKVLYVSGEESPVQIKGRAERLGVGSGDLFVLAESDLEAVLRAVESLSPELIVVDSIQMMALSDVQGAAGSVSQVRECGAALVSHAKTSGEALFLIGHVTKDGNLAGPRTLEHVVDTVLYFEGDRFQSLRLLRSMKNRFGPTHDVGVFEMEESGLTGLEDPSSLFLGTAGSPCPGGAVVPCLEGKRPLLVEIQGLVAPTNYGTPVRRVTGPDPNRLPMVLAVLEKRGGLGLSGHDIFVNAVGGIRVTEPAADLGMALAVASSFLDRVLAPSTLVAGEVGLRGEIRPVSRLGLRLAEGRRLGFTRAIVAPGVGADVPGPDGTIEILGVASVAEALEHLEPG